MITITEHGVNDAWQIGGRALLEHHIERESRAGTVWEYRTPVVTTYERPWECVLFDPIRDANPFFHLMEAVWMLSGRNDVAWINQFNSRMKEFSDDGEKFHGAYGFRWRNHFCLDGGDEPIDQIERVISILDENPDDRRAVISMWDPMSDLDRKGVDFPCNTTIYFKGRPNRTTMPNLDMTVCCRSNDIIWGLYGSNAVHFSILHRVIASCLGWRIGRYHHFSDSFHLYTEQLDKIKHLGSGGFKPSPYWDNVIARKCLVSGQNGVPVENWYQFSLDIKKFIEQPSEPVESEWINEVVRPMYWTYMAFKNKGNPNRYEDAFWRLADMPGNLDWTVAAREWLNRRKEKWNDSLRQNQ